MKTLLVLGALCLGCWIWAVNAGSEQPPATYVTPQATYHPVQSAPQPQPQQLVTVAQFQQALIAHGYLVGATGADGIYGPATQKAWTKCFNDHVCATPADPLPVQLPAYDPQVGPFIPYEGNGGGPTLCADGMWSHSSGSGTCSHHGGEANNDVPEQLERQEDRFEKTLQREEAALGGSAEEWAQASSETDDTLNDSLN